jgi:predicted dehydrogenase
LYRINAPVIPADHWTLDPDTGGGRFVGEGCHFIDLICYLANSEVVKVVGGFLGSDSPTLRSRDNLAITICFANGDIGTIVYSGQGNANLSKERIEVFVAGRVVVIDDFKSFKGYGVSVPVLELKRPDKGFRAHLENFFSAVKGESELVTTVDDGLKVAMIIERMLCGKFVVKSR